VHPETQHPSRKIHPAAGSVESRGSGAGRNQNPPVKFPENLPETCALPAVQEPRGGEAGICRENDPDQESESLQSRQ